MELRDLIEKLEAMPQEKVFARGFYNPHSWRGVYSELAFEPAENVTVASMLADAKSALGKTFTGYKGGDFLMVDYTDVHLANYGECGDDDGMLRIFFDDELAALRSGFLIARKGLQELRESIQGCTRIENISPAEQRTYKALQQLAEKVLSCLPEYQD